MTLKNSLKLLAASLLIAGVPLAFAQAASAPAASSSPAKKELINKLLELQKPGVEALANNVVQGPLRQLAQQAAGVVQKMPADKRDAAGKSVEADLKKFNEVNGAMLRERALKLQPTTMGAAFEQNFTEDELRQLLAFMQSPVSKKYGEVANEMQKELVQKLMQENGPTLQSRFQTLELDVSKDLGLHPAAAGASAPKAAAKPAPAPAKK